MMMVLASLLLRASFQVAQLTVRTKQQWQQPARSSFVLLWSELRTPPLDYNKARPEPALEKQ